MDAKRYLIVTADDFGMGPATSQGILDLASQGLITGTVLLVNSPYAEQAVREWHRFNRPMELGWHPCLTLDRPVLPPHQVPSLIDGEGNFPPLGQFVRRLWLGRLRPREIQAELQAQFERFQQLVGLPPRLVNSHHHIQVFSPVGFFLADLLKRVRPAPYVRRVREPWSVLARVPGARVKRLFLSALGRWDSWLLDRAGHAGNDWLAGITDPPCVADPDFLTRWLKTLPGRVAELTCHPGYLDTTLVGRDCTPESGQLQRRVRELYLLRHPSFLETCRQAGFTLISPVELAKVQEDEWRQAA